MSADKPLVSIVVPTYKRSDRIRVALDSIAAQDYGAENIELIVVSDNRRDRRGGRPLCREPSAL